MINEKNYCPNCSCASCEKFYAEAYDFKQCGLCGKMDYLTFHEESSLMICTDCEEGGE
jgi:hypothetical protein